MKNNSVKNISVISGCNPPRAELMINGNKVKLNFLVSGSAGGIEDAKRMMKKSLLDRELSREGT